jgi:LPXTG-motif cell wall-anchored protein
VYNDAGDHNFPLVGGHFICGPTQGEKGDTGAPGADGHDGAPGADGHDGAPGADGVNCYDNLKSDEDVQLTADDCIGATGPAGADGSDGSNGSDGTNGSSGLNGTDGVAGLNGTNGSAGVDVTSQSDVDNLRSVVTELNNRLFVLEHAVPAAPGDTATTTTTTQSEPLPGGDLPHTGAGETFALLGAGAGLIGLGLGFRSLRRRTA